MSACHHDISIRPARDNEARACRILLPEMFTADQSPDLVVAVQADPATPDMRRFAGALALSSVHGPRIAGFSVLLHVLPAFRRQGIGRALMEAAMARCLGRTHILRALRPVETGSAAALFMEASGLTNHDEIRHFEADSLPLHAQMQALRKRLEERSMIPANARVVALRDAPAAAIADMVTAEFPATRAHVLARLTDGAAGGYDLDHSVALLVGDHLGGVLFGVWRDGMPTIEGRIVAPAFRGGWANILLLEKITNIGVDLGARRFQFFADSKITDTMSLARRAGAREIRVERHYWRDLT